LFPLEQVEPSPSVAARFALTLACLRRQLEEPGTEEASQG
jgi:hypothetical protein